MATSKWQSKPDKGLAKLNPETIKAVIAFPILDALPNRHLTNSETSHVLNQIDLQRLRRVGISSDNRFRSLKYEGIELQRAIWPYRLKVNLERIEVFQSGAINVLLCYFEIQEGSGEFSEILEALRRPGTAEIRAAIASLGFEVDASAQIRATTALRVSNPNSNSVHDASIEVSHNVPEFLFKEDWGLLLALVCSERILLDRVAKFLSSGNRSHRLSQKFLRQLVQWQTVLGSDSAAIQSGHENVRRNLRLDERYVQFLEILNEDSRLYERKCNFLGLFSGISATLIGLPSEIYKPLAWSIAVSIGVIIFFTVGRIRR